MAHAGEDIAMDRIHVYKQKGLMHLHVRVEDFRAYIGLMERLVNAAQKPQLKVSADKRAKLVSHTLSLINQELMDLPISDESFDHVNSILSATVKLVTSDEDSFELLKSLENLSEQVFSHSVAVSIYSTLIAKAMDWSSTAIQMKVATAALIHDIGKRQLPPDLVDKRRSKMTAEELRLYETHPQRGFEIVSDNTRYSPEVCQAILHHHERMNGSGFPNHLMSSKIIRLANIIAVADEFAHEFEKCKSDKQEFPVVRATQHIISMKSDRLYAPAVDALVDVLTNKK